ncbi:cytidylyltransferase domain-containing protein [Melioribacter sp. OK-6-Me]|uniref:cytidylyltransferase domain-containing protein n=1 Tax=unclassified Melioribacter TaxID=2627329 RepID=UPI003ED9D0A7
MRIVTVIQARMTSTRLPGKVMLPVLEKPLITRMVERIQKSIMSDEIVVATSVQKEDDPIENLCRDMKVECFRGHLTDLLDRHYKAGVKYGADAVVKIPSDCPLIDPAIIDKVLKFFSEGDYDYASNLHPATYPDGNDVEIMSIEALEKAWREAHKNYEREHTTPYFWENPHLFKLGNVEWETGLNYSTTMRWTIDYEEDYLFIKRVFEELYPVKPDFGIYDILELLERKPEIKMINEKYLGKYWYENYLDELKNIDEYKIAINKKTDK